MIAPALIPAAATANNGAQKTSGTFAPFSGGTDHGITGTAVLTRKAAAERTHVRVQVEGLVPGETYPSHVHMQACDDGQAGGHYKNEPFGPAEPPNELWPSTSTDSASPGITANPEGKGVGTDQAAWLARPEAQSVVIHDYVPPHAKLACADLS